MEAFSPIALDMVATIVFAATYWANDNVILATAAGVAVGVARFAHVKARGLAIGPLQYLSIALVVVAGATTMLTNDPLFVMLKPSLVMLVVAAIMLTTNWLAPYLPPIVTETLSARVIGRASIGWAALEVALAAINAIVALVFGVGIWAWYASIVPTVIHLLAFAATYVTFRLLVARNLRAREAAEGSG